MYCSLYCNGTSSTLTYPIEQDMFNNRGLVNTLSHLLLCFSPHTDFSGGVPSSLCLCSGLASYMRKLGRLVAKGCYAHFAAGAWLSLGVGVAALTIALIATSMEEVVGTDIDDRDANATDSPSRVAVIQTDGASLNTGNRSRRPRQQPPRRENLLARRICYCCLVIPLVLAFVVSALSVLTLAIKNEDVRRKCKTGCLLTCSEVNWSECWIVLGGGAFVCSVLLLFMLSLVIRMCFATKL